MPVLHALTHSALLLDIRLIIEYFEIVDQIKPIEPQHNNGVSSYTRSEARFLIHMFL